MTFRKAELTNAIQAHGAVVRVLVTAVKGSAPRGAGTAMLVWQGGQSGTIGGGTLEFEATKRARDMLAGGIASMQRTEPLGPALGQCCGGTVTLVFERFTPDNLPEGYAHIFARPVSGASREMPLTLHKQIMAAGNAHVLPMLVDNWLAESLWQPVTPVWIYGAGHVGRALTSVLAPLPEFGITLIDRDKMRMPARLPHGVDTRIAPDMAALVEHAPHNTQHFVMTMSHAIDLEICAALLQHPFAFAGLIGSKTKWARFRSQLEKQGHTAGEIARITCPIGDPSLGKEPQAIAVGITHRLLQGMRSRESRTDIAQTTGEE